MQKSPQISSHLISMPRQVHLELARPYVPQLSAVRWAERALDRSIVSAKGDASSMLWHLKQDAPSESSLYWR